MSEKDIRWKQRFQNFEKAYMRLKEAMEMEKLTELFSQRWVKYVRSL